MEFRSRCAMMLEAALRTAVACRSLKLATTIVETVGMFKIGCYPTQTQWFDGVMQRTYGCMPRLQIKDTNIENLEEKVPGVYKALPRDEYDEVNAQELLNIYNQVNF